MVKGSVKQGHSRVIVIAERCKECGFCIEFCPQKAITKSTDTNSRGYHIVCLDDSGKCTGCNICEMICPEFAISVVPIKEPKKAEVGECPKEDI